MGTINNEVTADIAKAEGFSMPVLLILLTVIFGSLAAASLPVAIGGVAILGSFTVLRLLTMATTVSIYSVNITTILGWAWASTTGSSWSPGSARNCTGSPPSSRRSPGRWPPRGGPWRSRASRSRSR